MKVIHKSLGIQNPFPSSVLTIGNFDGVHKGHQALIQRVVQRARELGVPAIAMTFDPHPVTVLHPDRKLHRIFSMEDQHEQLARQGLDYLVVEPFSREFSQLPPERYLLEWIYRPFVPETLVVGYDFSFGADRRGSIDFLKEHADPLGMRVEVVPPVKVGEVLVSSSRIRKALQEGDVRLARELLGRPFYIEGLVEKGAGRGRAIGVPTANVRSSAETVPMRGVYAAWAEVRGQRWKALVNIGYNPTFVADPAPLMIEAHLPDWGRAGEGLDLYGEQLRLEFIDRIRDETKFASVSALVEQIHRDIEEGKRILS